MSIKHVVCRLQKKGELNTYIIEFHFSEKDLPYQLFVNNVTDEQGLASQLSSLANVISRPTPLALDGATAPITSGDLPADVLVGDGVLPEPPRQ